MSASPVQISQTSSSEIVRRLIDIIAATIGLLVLSPFLLLILVAIKLDSAGPLFYQAQRIGRNGVLFKLFKFRTMVVNADKRGPPITTAGDNRITRVGRFLRRTKLDELPQLINVLRGDMSLVGPRPEDPRYVALYTSVQYGVLHTRPGITSAASLAYRREEQLLVGPNWENIYCKEVLPAKLAIELDYLARRTLLSDLQLILQTIISMFR